MFGSVSILRRMVRNRSSILFVLLILGMLSSSFIVGYVYQSNAVLSRDKLALFQSFLRQTKDDVEAVPRKDNQNVIVKQGTKNIGNTPDLRRETAPSSYVTTTSSATTKDDHFVTMAANAPVHHISYLKVHKTGSSTTQAIFLRYGWDKNLTFVLAPEFNNTGYPNVISYQDTITDKNIVPPPKNKTYDIMCNHVVYDSTEFRKIMPKDTVYIGSIRQPFQWFQSMLNYFRVKYVFKLGALDGPSKFLRNPQLFEPKLSHGMPFTNNRMSFEFGFPVDKIRSRDFAAFYDYLEQLVTEYKLVIIAERYDESLVLMRRYLHWEMKDILYMRKLSKSNYAVTLKKSDEVFYRQHSRFDYLLYDFFFKRLLTQIENEGVKFIDEVDRFRQVLETVQNYCIPSKITEPYIAIEASEWNNAFNVTKEECVIMKMQEISFIQKIRKRQYGIEPTWTWPKSKG